VSDPSNPYQSPQTPASPYDLYPPPPSNNLATAAMVLGIVSLPMSLCCGILAIPLSIAALITGFLGLHPPGKGQALAGIICGALALVLTIAMIAISLAINLGAFQSFPPPQP
jgi:hypothetical protein